MFLISADISSLDTALNWWERIEYASETFVILGCLGELVADFTEIRTPEWRHRFGRTSLVILIAALSIELVALVRTNGLSGEEITLLNTVTADARTRAANAEGAAKGFDARIAEAQRGTAEAQRDAANAKERASRADERASKNEKEAAALRKRAEDERTARVKIEESVAWRRLTARQQTEIGLHLSKFPPHAVSVWYSAPDMECETFAGDIARALRTTGTWAVGPPGGMIHMGEGGAFTGPISELVTGVIVASTSEAPSRAAADAIVQELSQLGFDAARSPRTVNSKVPQIGVNVEHRPEGPQGEAKVRAKGRP